MIEFAFATKGVIFNENNEVLLLMKSESEDINPNSVDIPGGRLEYKEKPEEGLVREIKEEVGINITIIAPSRIWTMVKEEKEFQLVGATFLCIAKSGQKIVLSDEHASAVWTPITDIAKKDFPEWIKAEVESADTIRKY